MRTKVPRNKYLEDEFHVFSTTQVSVLSLRFTTLANDSVHLGVIWEVIVAGPPFLAAKKPPL